MPIIASFGRRFGFLLFIGAIGVVGFVFRDHLSGSAGDLRVGDCFDEPAAEVEEIGDVQHRPCTDPHDAEVIVVKDYAAPDGAVYPSDTSIENFIDAQCVAAADTYTDGKFDVDTDLYVGLYRPTAESWTDGERGMMCYLYRNGGAKLTTALRTTS